MFRVRPGGRGEVPVIESDTRIREVRQGPDDFLYVLTDENDGVLLRIEPAE